MAFVLTWMDLGDVMLSEITVTKGHMVHDSTLHGAKNSQTHESDETEQDPMVLPLHVLHLPFVCGKILARDYV